MAGRLLFDAPIGAGQLRRLHALWHQWGRHVALTPEADRRLRHYYVQIFSEGRALETKQLTRADAARIIAWLERLVRHAPPQQNRAAGTAGRHGFAERRRVQPNAAAWRALWAVARALGMDRKRLEHFIRSHYAGVGLRGLSDLRTMADLNRVLWGLKAMVRRGPGAKQASRNLRRAA
jgi:hypothetical protein